MILLARANIFATTKLEKTFLSVAVDVNRGLLIGDNMAKISFWTSYWGLSMDPFSEEPLYYNRANFEKLLVRYAPIEEVDEILSDLYKEKARLMKRRYYVIGLRGMGKTTVLNYIVKKTLTRSHERIMCIYVNNVHVKDPEDVIDPARDPEKLRLSFCLRTIEALFDTVLHRMKELVSDYSTFRTVRDKYFELKGKTKIDQATAEALLKEYLSKLKTDFDIFILLYDELDKIDSYDTVLRFLRSSQALLETLSEYGCVVFLCGVPDFSKTLHSSEYSGVSGHDVWIHTWTPQDAKALIKSRLEYALHSGEFPFRDKVIEGICSRAECRPRMIQNQARDALVWGAYGHRKVIDEKFLEDFVWDDESTSRFKADVKSSKDLEEGTRILRRVYDPDRDDPTTYYLLLKTYEAVSLFPSHLRDKYGIDIEMDQFERHMHLLKEFDAINERETVEGTKYYVLANKIEHLFRYVKNTLKRKLEYLPRAVKVDLTEIKESKLEFSLRNEITKMLVMNPQRRYRRAEIVKEVMGNPDAKIRAVTYYKVAAEKDLKSKLLSATSTVLHGLIKDGSLMQLASGSVVKYQLSEAIEEVSWAKGLRLDEDVLQNFQSAIKTFRQSDFSGSVPLLRLAVENSLRHLAEVRNIELPDKAKLDTLGPINESLYQSKIYDQGVKTMIDAFNIEVGPITHGAIKLEDNERAKNLIERAQMIIRRIYLVKKETSSK